MSHQFIRRGPSDSSATQFTLSELQADLGPSWQSPHIRQNIGQPYLPESWSASGKTGHFDGRRRIPAPQSNDSPEIPLHTTRLPGQSSGVDLYRISDLPPADARRYRGRDVFDLYANVKSGVIPPGHFVYALYRSSEAGGSVRLLRHAQVERRRDGAPGGELRWAEAASEVGIVARPLSKSIVFVVTAGPVDGSFAPLMLARQESRISANVSLPDRVTIHFDRNANDETQSDALAVRFRSREKTRHSDELESLLDLVVLGRHKEERQSFPGKLRNMLRTPENAPTVCVSSLEIQSAEAAALDGTSPVSDVDMQAWLELLDGMHGHPAVPPPKPMNSSKDLLDVLARSIGEACGQADGGHAAEHVPLQSIVSREVNEAYEKLMNAMTAMTEVDEKHPARERVDIYANEALTSCADDWLKQLTDWVKQNKREDAAVDEREIEALARLYCLARSEELNAESILADLDALDDGKIRMQGEFESKLARYGLSRSEVKALLQENNIEAVEYSLRTVWRAMKLAGRFGNLRAQRWRVIRLVANVIAQGALRGTAPSLYSNIIHDGKFDLTTFTEYWGMAYLSSDLLRSNAQAGTENMLLGSEISISRQWLDRTFYGDDKASVFDEESFDKMFNTLERGRDAASDLLRDAVNQVGPALMQVLFAGGVLSTFDPRLALTGLASLPIMYFLARYNNRKLEPLYRKANEEIDATATNNRQNIKGAPDLQGLTAREDMLAKLRNQVEKERTLARGLEARKARQSLASALALDAGVLLTVTTGVVSGLPAGNVLASALAFGGVAFPSYAAMQTYFGKGPRHTLDVFELKHAIEDKLAIDDPSGLLDQQRIPVSALPDRSITLKDVGFSHQAKRRPDAIVYEHINETIRQGELVVMVGGSGSGKSTALRLISGVYTPTAGEVAIGNVPRDQIKQHGEDSLQHIIHVASQTASFFKGSVFYNLLANMRYTEDDDELWRRYEALVKRITQMQLHPKRFAPDEPFPRYISPGERIRLSALRAFMPELMKEKHVDRGIVLADEPTAGLDERNRRIVIELMRELHEGGTTLVVVSHEEPVIEFAAGLGRLIDMDRLKTEGAKRR